LNRWILFTLLLPTLAQAAIPWQAWEHQDEMLNSAWDVWGMNAPVAVLAAQIHQESGWDCNARSWAGAEGCAQFMPLTAQDMARLFPEFCWPADPYDSKWALRCRDLYLRSLIRAIHNDYTGECDDWALGLRAYNGGLGNLRKDQRLTAASGADRDNWIHVQSFNAGRKLSAYRENTEYPVRIFRLAAEYEVWGASLACLTEQC
jgi:soluble lytic murein transglycosylase-like protein